MLLHHSFKLLTCSLTAARRGASTASVFGSDPSNRKFSFTFRCCFFEPQLLDASTFSWLALLAHRHAEPLMCRFCRTNWLNAASLRVFNMELHLTKMPADTFIINLKVNYSLSIIRATSSKHEYNSWNLTNKWQLQTMVEAVSTKPLFSVQQLSNGVLTARLLPFFSTNCQTV